MWLLDSIAIVSYTPDEEVQDAEEKKRPPQPEAAFLVQSTTQWDIRDLIDEWIVSHGVDPWDVTVVSCSIEWDPFTPFECWNPEEHDSEEFEDHWSEHRYCHTTGADRLDYAAEMVGYNEEYLDPDEPDELAHRIGWVVSDLIGSDEAYPGVDYKQVHVGRFPVWEASLYGGVLMTA